MSTVVRGDATDRPTRLFPLVRHLSVRLSPVLLRTPCTPNQLTLLSMALGLACGWLLAQGGRTPAVLGALCLVASYVLDNCDGEVARAKGLSSPWGAVLDSSVDWLVHAAVFAGLGIGTERVTGQPVWAWLGWIAAAGVTINSAISIPREARRVFAPDARPVEEAFDAAPGPGREWFVYVFRELTRADFCVILLALAALDLAWLLLPAGAVGAQVYWMSGLWKGADRFHV